MRLKEVLKKKVSKKEQALVRGSFDVIGQIALIEIPDALKKKQKIIANAVLSQNPAIKSVFKKVGAHKGRFRIQKVVWLAGAKKTESLHKESGVILKLDVAKCYFSPRLVSERLRIANLVKPGERILVLFSGVGPYTFVLAKHSPASNIVSIEKNPIAHKYAIENRRINKISVDKVQVFCGDVKKQVPLLKEKFDRIIMPLPKGGDLFLELVLSKIKKKGMIHLYQFAQEGEEGACVQKILEKCSKSKCVCRVVRSVKAGQSAPRTYRFCFDIEIE